MSQLVMEVSACFLSSKLRCYKFCLSWRTLRYGDVRLVPNGGETFRFSRYPIKHLHVKSHFPKKFSNFVFFKNVQLFISLHFSSQKYNSKWNFSIYTFGHLILSRLRLVRKFRYADINGNAAWCCKCIANKVLKKLQTLRHDLTQWKYFHNKPFIDELLPSEGYIQFFMHWKSSHI